MTLGDGTKLFSPYENFTWKLRFALAYRDLLQDGERGGKATIRLLSARNQKASLPLHQCAPEGDMNFLPQNAVPDEQGSPSIYLGGGFNHIRLSTLAYANGKT